MSREDVSETPSTVGVEDHREKTTDPDDEYEGPSGKAKATRKRYSKQMVNYLLDTIEEFLPYGNREWDMVVQKFNVSFQVKKKRASKFSLFSLTSRNTFLYVRSHVIMHLYARNFKIWP